MVIMGWGQLDFYRHLGNGGVSNRKLDDREFLRGLIV